MANLEEAVRRLAGTVGLGLDNTPPFPGQNGTVIHQLTDLPVQYLKAAADGAAGTATADTLVWTNPFDFPVVVVAATLTPTSAAITADPANFATITVKTNNAAGGATGIALTLTTATADSGNIAQNVGKGFTAYTGANAQIPAGGGLWFNIAKSGTGVVVPISQLNIRLQRGAF